MLTTIGLALMITTGAFDGPPVMIVETKISQYREAADGVRRDLAGLLEIDPSDPTLSAKVAEAPVVVAVGRKSFEVARALTQQPVIFCMVLGVSESELSRSVTGVPMAPDPTQVLARLHAFAPEAKRIGYIHGARNDDILTHQVEAAAGNLGLTLVERAVADGSGAKAAFDELNGAIDALYLPPDPKLFSQELLRYVLTAAAERKLPTMGFLDSITQAGALASVSPNYTEIGVRAGKLANEILRRPEGRRTPVPPPAFASGSVSVNLTTSHVLGLKISDSLKASANQVFQ